MHYSKKKKENVLPMYVCVCVYVYVYPVGDLWYSSSSSFWIGCCTIRCLLKLLLSSFYSIKTEIERERNIIDIYLLSSWSNIDDNSNNEYFLEFVGSYKWSWWWIDKENFQK